MAQLHDYLSSTQHNAFQKANLAAEADMVKEVRKKVIKIKITRDGAAKTLGDIFQCHKDSMHMGYLKEYDELLEQEQMGTRLSGQETYALWCTLSPEPGSCAPQDLLDAMSKIGKKKGIAIMTWAIEQSGTARGNNVGYHPHTHFLIMLDKTVQNGERSKMLHTVIRICKPFRTKSDVYLQVRPISEASYPKKLDYLHGRKTDAGKHQQVSADQTWRQDNGFDPIYFSKQNLDPLG